MKHTASSGFTVVEVLIAMAIMVMSISAVAMVVYGAEGVGSDGEIQSEALGISQAMIEGAQAIARKDFKLLVPTTTTETVGPITYTKTLSVRTLGDLLSKEITANVTWVGSYGRTGQYVRLSSLVSNFSAAQSSDTCDSVLSGDWTDPTQTDYAMAGPVSTIDAAFGKVYVGLAQTSSPSSPSLFVYSTTSLSSALGSVDIATSTTVGPAMVTVVGKYAYVADGYGANFGTCFNPDDLSDTSTLYGGACSQLKIVDVSVPSNPTVKYFYKAPGVTGTAGQGRGVSVAYKNGYLYLGLGKTGSGPEFHIIDVHNPLFPVARGSFAVGRSVTAITIRNNYAYLATDDNTKQLMVLDISNPYNPVVASGSVYNPGGVGLGRSLFAVGDDLYFGRTFSSPNKELYVLDIKDPTGAMPAPKGSFTLGATAAGVIVRDTLAFIVTTTTSKLQVLRISDPSAISSVTQKSLPYPGTTLECEANSLYAGSGSGASGSISVFTAN